MAKNNDDDSMGEAEFEARAGAGMGQMEEGDLHEARQLSLKLARTLFIGMQKLDNTEAVDQRSSEFKEKWTAERPKMVKLSRFVLRRLFAQGYQFSSSSEKPFSSSEEPS